MEGGVRGTATPAPALPGTTPAVVEEKKGWILAKEAVAAGGGLAADAPPPPFAVPPSPAPCVDTDTTSVFPPVSPFRSASSVQKSRLTPRFPSLPAPSAANSCSAPSSDEDADTGTDAMGDAAGDATGTDATGDATEADRHLRRRIGAALGGLPEEKIGASRPPPPPPLSPT